MNFYVCGIQELMETIFRNKITHVLTLIEKEVTVDLSKCWSVENHKIINFQDVWNKDGNAAPTIENCKEVLEWGKTLPQDANVLIHCYAGISRSTCGAFALMYQNACQEVDQNHKIECLRSTAKELVRIRPIAFPNTLMAEYFDQLFVTYGAFKREVELIREQSPFLLKIKEVE